MLKRDPKTVLKAIGMFIAVCVITNSLRDHLKKRDVANRRTHELFDDLFLARGCDNKQAALDKIVSECNPNNLARIALQQHAERGNDDRLCLLLQALDRMGPKGSKCLKKTCKLLRTRGYAI